MGTLIFLQNVLTVAVGLGFVIFFHELGHFLVAKWNGVKVEKFSIGFGPALLRWRGEETEYALSAFPLGGFVKMLGENPEEEAQTSTDPRAYHNKSVGARMAIISAGVLMNLVLGLGCFALAYAWGGLREISGEIGSVVAGQSAYAAGVRAGDRIVAIDGRPGASFEDLLRTVTLSGTGQVVRLDLERPGQEGRISVDVEPRREADADRPTIGIGPSNDLILFDKPPFLTPPGLDGAPAGPDGGFRGGDRIVEVGPPDEEPRPVADALELNRALAEFRDKPLTFGVERRQAESSVKAAPGDDGASKGTPKARVTLPPNRFVDLGARLAIGPVAAIRGDSIAEGAGFRLGDRIITVDGRDDFDPMRLPSYAYEHAGQPIAFEVERPAPDGEGVEVVSLAAKPDPTPPWSEPIRPDEPLEVPGLGLAYTIRPEIVGVRDESPAARAGLKPGEVIRALTLTYPGIEGEDPQPLTFLFGQGQAGEEIEGEVVGWPYAFALLQAGLDGPSSVAPAREVKLTLVDSKAPIAIRAEPVADWFNPQRGLRLDVLQRPIPPLGAVEAVRRGGREALDKMAEVYYMLRGLGQGRVSGKNIGGPIRIAQIAYAFASSGLAPFIYFLGVLSVNLTVLNFLPIPPLDGGQMVFLIAEKIRGRPLPESALIALTYAGLLLVLGLMVFFIFQDVMLSLF